MSVAGPCRPCPVLFSCLHSRVKMSFITVAKIFISFRGRERPPVSRPVLIYVLAPNYWFYHWVTQNYFHLPTVFPEVILGKIDPR
jgi:hypothetical protein